MAKKIFSARLELNLMFIIEVEVEVCFFYVEVEVQHPGRWGQTYERSLG
jgi:hypothetical protein